MATVLIFLAKPPDDLAISEEVAHSDGNVAIEAIDGRIKELISRGNLTSQVTYERAAYLRDIAIKLKERTDARLEPPDIVQIIGHGSPGRVELGQYWSRKHFDESLGYAVLDSNPYGYGLLNEYLSPMSRVILVGCFVGGKASKGDFVADGPTLLHDLEQMSGGSAYASDAWVSPEHLSDDVLYTSSLITSNGTPANPLVFPEEPRRPMRPSGGMRTLTFERLIAAPVLGLMRGSNLDISIPSDSKSLLDQHFVEVSMDQKLLAMTELEFEVSEFDQPAQLICGGLLVRVFDPQTSRTLYFADTPNPREKASPIDLVDLEARRRGARTIFQRLSAAAWVGRRAISIGPGGSGASSIGPGGSAGLSPGLALGKGQQEP
jgi:hypothetical protein